MSIKDFHTDLEKFCQKEKIGEGSFGTVYLVKKIGTGEHYAAKVLNVQINNISQEDKINLSREVNINAGMNHPAVLKFVGYSPDNFQHEPNPVILTEYCKNGSLQSLIANHDKYKDIWNDTKKLITIFGIACGMKYLHDNNIIHRDLKTGNILIDDILRPKIADFGLSKKIHIHPNSMSVQSSNNLKGTPIFWAPELFETNKCTNMSDVYAFGFILYEIVTDTTIGDPSYMQLQFCVASKHSPEFKIQIPDSYRCLIERCWSPNPFDRPKFSEIVTMLKTDKGFITDNVKEDEFRCYVESIEEYHSSFETRKIIKPEEYTSSTSKVFQEIDLKRYSEQPKKSFFSSVLRFLGFTKEKLFPEDEYNKLGKDCQRLVVEARNDPEKQYYIGTLLIEGKDGFPVNVKIGIKYFESSIAGGNINSAIYLSQILFNGEIIPQNLSKAKKYLSAHLNDDRASLLYGKILLKENKKKEAQQYFQKGAENGDSESMYFYAQMLFAEEKNIDKAKRFFKQSKDQGFIKSDLYLKCLDKMSNEQSFARLSPEIQHFFILEIIDYNYSIGNNAEIITNQVVKMKSEDTEKLFINNLFDSEDFINILQSFEYIRIEISYPSRLVDAIYQKVSAMKKYLNIVISIYICGLKNITSNLKIFNIQGIDPLALGRYSSSGAITVPPFVPSNGGVASTIFEKIACPSISFGYSSFYEIVNFAFMPSNGDSVFQKYSSLEEIIISSSATSIGDSAFSDCWSLTLIIIPSSVTSIGDYAFNRCFLLTQMTIPSSVTSIGEFAFNGCFSLREITIPSSVTSIGKYAFNVCYSLTEITIPSSATSIGDYTFWGCLSLTKIAIPSSITSIGEFAFGQCFSLEEITIPSSVTSIGESAFYRCSSLTQIAIPSSVTEIRDSTFNGCSLLTEITIPFSVTSIGDDAFNECLLLTEIAIPSSVTSIGRNAFPSNTIITRI